MQLPRLCTVLAKSTIPWVMLLLFAGPCSAQGFLKKPEVNIFAGYSLQRYDASQYGFQDTQNLNGGNLEISLPDLYRGLGVVADFSGHWNDEIETFNFTGGPQYRFEVKGIDFFGHALFGKSRSRLLRLGASQIEPSSLGGTAALGGGADIPFGKRFAFRAIQADYLINSAFGVRHYDMRYSAGLVIIFGKRPAPPSF
jgi:hypothetical protein